VSDHRGHGTPTPGWYADPTGLAGVRWWDGAQWTAHTAPLPASGPGAPTGARPPIPDTTPVYTPFIWLIVLLPLLSSASIWFYQPTLPRITAGRYPSTDPFSTFTPGYFLVLGIGVVIYALSVVFASLDHRELARRGVVRPFHWAWTFLSPLVYVIGRGVIVRSVAKPRGLTPIWVLIGVMVVGFAVSIAWSAVLFAQLGSQISQLSTTYGS
jgi:hypothetical protein